ncbi:Panacea domain-containing protein [Candidatus Phytoplasma solani]|uniref:Panacea domain-containing protein n=1 Tax=Candidatus Phytoplasma solani TaxID=69896 RepID=UPI00358E534D
MNNKTQNKTVNLKTQIKKLKQQIAKLNKKLATYEQKCYNFVIERKGTKVMNMENQKNKINVFDVVDFFLKKDKKLNKTKIQKLLYYSQGYYIAKYDNVLFPERIEAWPYGPVVPDVYAEALRQEIQPFFKYFDFENEKSNLPLTIEQKEILEQVFNKFGYMTASQLTKLTHKEEPWKKTYDPEKLYSSCVIEPNILCDFFCNKKTLKKIKKTR